MPEPGGSGRPVRSPASAPGLYAIETWGCQMNVHDSEKMAGALQELGYRPAPGIRDADVILLNTCAIREKASQKVFTALGRLRRLKQRNPRLLLGVTGCVAQMEGERIFRRAPFVDLVLGPRGIGSLPQLLAEARSRRAVRLEPQEDSLAHPFDATVREDAVKAFVTVMEGCNKRCTFCVVPRTRGREESRSLEHVLQEVRFLASRGYREVELLGQNVNTYRDGVRDFADLLRAVDGVEGIQRIRFTTSHPLHFEDRIIDAMASCRHVCPSVHLPVQSGSDRVLRRMRRGYDRRRYLQRVARLRAAVPGCAVSTDIIVGFPGESEEDFQETLSLAEAVRFEKMFSFVFSPREGTAAGQMVDDTPLATKRERLARLQHRQQQIQAAIHAQRVGGKVAVLVEGPARTGQGIYVGRTPENFLAHFPGHDGMVGRVLPVAVESATALALYGRVAPESLKASPA